MSADSYKMANLLCVMLATLCIGASSLMAADSVSGSVFNPAQYDTLNSGAALEPEGTVEFFTGNVDNPTPTITVDGGDPIAGIRVTNESGNVVLAMFNFSSIDISSDVVISRSGSHLGLVLASQSDFTFSSTLNLSTGWRGGAPGAEGGTRNSSYQSNPPDGDRGNGGLAHDDGTGSDNDPRLHGQGYGGGERGKWSGSGGYYGGGGGGAYGGEGGDGCYTGSQIGHGGTAYGDDLLTDLYGGSGGGGGYQRGAGGGAGGSVSLVASGTLILDGGTVQANGASGYGTNQGKGGGGGGSGGGILLAARTIRFGPATATLSAAGGDGGQNDNTNSTGGSGGPGGGGRIALYGAIQNIENLTYSVDTGDLAANHDGNATVGEEGTFRYTGDGEEGEPEWPWPPASGTVFFIR